MSTTFFYIYSIIFANFGIITKTKHYEKTSPSVGSMLRMRHYHSSKRKASSCYF